MATPKYFTFAEMIRSRTAKDLGIDNTPTWEEIDNLRDLCENILDPLRAAYGKRTRVSSGFRCERLNKAVGGSKTSVHKRGSAADLQPIEDTFDNFRNFVVAWFKATGTKFDQILLERDKRTGELWIHIGQYNNSGQQRGIIRIMEVNG